MIRDRLGGDLGRQALAMLLVLTIVAQPLAGVAAAAGSGTNGELNWSDSQTMDPFIQAGNVTIAEHDRTEMSDPLAVYNDNGDVTKLPGRINESEDDPMAVRFDKVEDVDLREFPRKSGESNNSVTAIDHTEWTTGGQNSTKISVTDADGTTAGSVKAVKIATDGSMASGDVAYATFSNFSITSDVPKRVAQIIGNVNTLDSGTTATVRLLDSDGDYVRVKIASSANASKDVVMASSTGQGYVFQEKVNTFAVKGTGDGTMGAIEKVRVHAQDGDVSLTLTGLDAERKTSFTLGETIRDTDGDGNEEPVTVEELNSGGDMSLELTSLSTLPSMLDDATIFEMVVQNVEFPLSKVASENVNATFSDAPNYNYPKKLELYGRLKLPGYIDVSYSDLSLRGDQTFVSQRYVTAEIAEGTGSTALENVSSWTDVSGKYDSKGSNPVLDNTVQVGTNYDIHLVVLLKSGEVDSLKAPVGGGTGGATGESSFLPSWLTGIPGMIVGTLTGILGIFTGSKIFGG